MKENLLFDLLNQKSIQLLFKIFDKNRKEIYLVGGCVRDAFLGKISPDIDVAANVIPSDILETLNKNNIKYDNFAYKYGSIIAYIGGQKFQITTFREDRNQIGRHTNIIFTNDIKKDAARRDFTINSMYLSNKGELTDLYNGKEDLSNQVVKFIGNIEESIREDYLRIFRYYRFIGIFKNPKIIKGYEEVLSEYCKRSFNYLPNDLIRIEILKMFNNAFLLNSFFNKNNAAQKKYWIESTKEHFIKTSYKLGLHKCLNKIDLLIN